jgi:putative transposase
MARPLSMDLRERAVARLAAGESSRAVAAALSVAPSSVVKWSQRMRATGSVAPGKTGGHVPPKISGSHRIWLVQRTGAEAFTLRGLVAELAGRGLQVDYRTVWKFVHREGLSFKKNRAGQRAGPSRCGPQAHAVEGSSGAL